MTEGDPSMCPVCGRSVSRDENTTESPYCSMGCRQIDERLQTEGMDPERTTTSTADAHAFTYFQIDGMHSVACEEYLKGRAKTHPGVQDATASYVTETVRVAHEPGIDIDDLQEILSPPGYDAYRRDDATAAGPGYPRGADDPRKERAEQLLSFRYIAGVLFGSFLLLPYVALVYPAHLAEMIDLGFLSMYRDVLTLDGAAGFLFLRVYAALTAIILLFTGLPVLRGAYLAIRTRRPNTDLLVAIPALAAYVYGIVAIVIGGTNVFFDLTVVIAASVTAASFYESDRKRAALERLTDLTVSQVDEATQLTPDGETEIVPVEALEAGDRVIVPEGERVPVDGKLLGDACTVDEAVVTGESVPVRREPGEPIVGGAIVTNDAATIEVGTDSSSGIARIAESVWRIQSSEHGVQRRADRMAGIAVPLVALTAVLFAGGTTVLGWRPIEAGLATLVICIVGTPWAIGLATPLAIATSIDAAMDRDVVLFDETMFSRLRDVDTVVFDKTGTLTKGSTEILEATAPSRMLEEVAALEQRASHPAANAIATAFEVGSESDPPTVTAFESHETGVVGEVDGRTVAAGAPELFATLGWSVDEELAREADSATGFGRIPVLVGAAGRAEGLVIVGDEPRAGWDRTVEALAEAGIEVIVLTGDDEAATEYFRQHGAVSTVFSAVPPAGKTAAIERLRVDRTVAMVGDGTNDAPALAAADLGIALGSGTALAADAADIAITTDNLTAVTRAFELARAARRRVRTAAALALLYNVIAIPLALAGMLNPVTVMGTTLLTGGVIGWACTRPLLRDSTRTHPGATT